MFTVALLLLLQAILLLGIGHWILRRIFSIIDPPLETMLLVGLGTVGMFANGLSIFLPIDEKIQALVFLIGLIGAIGYRKKILLAPATFWLFLLTISVGCIFWFFQAPAIRFGSSFYWLPGCCIFICRKNKQTWRLQPMNHHVYGSEYLSLVCWQRHLLTSATD